MKKFVKGPLVIALVMIAAVIGIVSAATYAVSTTNGYPINDGYVTNHGNIKFDDNSYAHIYGQDALDGGTIVADFATTIPANNKIVLNMYQGGPGQLRVYASPTNTEGSWTHVGTWTATGYLPEYQISPSYAYSFRYIALTGYSESTGNDWYIDRLQAIQPPP